MSKEKVMSWETSSPDAAIRAEFLLDEKGGLFYRVFAGSEEPVIEKSRLGIKTGAADFFEGMGFVSTAERRVSAGYRPPIGKKAEYTDEYNQRALVLSRGGHQMTVFFRVYNDGVAFRYYLTGTGAAAVEKEYSEFRTPGDTAAWGFPWRNDYEGYFDRLSAEELRSADISMPLLLSVNNNSHWVLLSEGNVYNANGSFCASMLKGSPGPCLRLAFTPQQGSPVVSGFPLKTPQRAAIIAPSLDGVVGSTLIENINPPSKIADTSWIKPGRAAWSWWSEDFNTFMVHSLARQKQYVDFAASMGWEYVTVDAGWVDWKDGTIRELCEYADKKGVGIFIWLNGSFYMKPEYPEPDNRYYADDFIDQESGEEIRHIEAWADWGIKGVKVDFMMDDSQAKMGVYQNIMETCARRRLMINFHGSTKPSGENRTWPHMISSEGVRGLEHYLDWPPMATASHNCILPFTRNAIGAMDYTPTGISNANKNTTHAHQLALSIIYQSGVQHFADSIDIYDSWLGTELLRVIPSTWDEIKLIGGFPGEYAAMARRRGQNWFIGAITTAPRELSIPLDFLEKGSHTAYLYREGETGEFLVKEERKLEGGTGSLKIPLMENGGCAILISNTLVPRGFEDGFTVYEAESPANTLGGSARIEGNANCSGGKKVCGLGGNDGTLQFNGITVPPGKGGRHALKVYFLTREVRHIRLSVNGGDGVELPLKLSSGSFNVVRSFTTEVNLVEGANNLRFYHDAPAPDLDKIAILRIEE